MVKLGPLAFAAAFAAGALSPAPAQAAVPRAVVADGAQSLELDVGAGRLLTLSGPAANVFVADPKVAEVRPGSASSLFVFGVGPGHTTIAALDADGHALAQYEVNVHASNFSAREAEAAVSRAMPGARVHVRAQGHGLVVTGQVETPEQQARILALVRGYAPDGQTVMDEVAVASAVQVSLRVRIAEVSRQVTRNLGINWQALGTIGSIGTLPAANLFVNGGTAAACAAGALFSVGCKGVNFNGIIDALAQDNLARVLAEPTLTVKSGQPASFLAGGEFPIPVAQQNNVVTIEFKRYGVRLEFVPTVLSSNRINVHVNPEVSQLSTQGAVQLSAGNSTIQVPALTVRRAETTVELGSGQSFAIAGLLLDTVTQANKGIPGLGDLPVIGALFRSDQFSRQETELVILVTPFIVRPVDDAAALHTPGEDTAPPSDLERILKLRQMAEGRPTVRARVPGQAGFIVQ
jgi:pilus assembly protein CpaC